jgi:uncharacterized protein (TIGR00255 family)
MTRLYSMTGFAGTSTEHAWGSLGVELRTVNHRYLEVSWRGPDELRQLEIAMREAITARLSRGKVDCRINLQIHEAGFSGSPNPELLARLAEWTRLVRESQPEARPPSVAELLAWPGMFRRETVAGEELAALAMQQLTATLDELTESRAREGDKLRTFLRERAEQIEGLRLDVSPRVPELVRQYQERLAQRLRDALGKDEEERVRQEVALYASRIDVEEELARLGVHVTELLRILERGGTVGKRLDFLMQELHREANTLGSKSVASQTSATALELKVLIEQMREQVQNLE